MGLFLQAALFGHGGYSTLGINACVMTLPALLAWGLFALLERVPWICKPWFRALLVSFAVGLWTLSLVYIVALLYANGSTQVSGIDLRWANEVVLHPYTLATVLVLAGVAAWIEHRVGNAPEFPVGLLIGELAVLVTVGLNGCVLVWGGEQDWPSLILATVVPHLVIAVVEGVILGFAVGFLVRVKPEMLRGRRREKTECLVDSAP
jgi:ABC-type Co2+ transport system permease subunit